MTGKRLEDMTTDEFEQMLDDFIDREPAEMPASTFFQALASLDRRKRQGAGVIHLRTRLIGNRLIVYPPEPGGTISVEGNQIVLEDGRRILLEYVADQAMAA